MKPTGEDTATAVKEWVKEEIKGLPTSRLELGKFFFGVSTATLGVLVTFKKLDTGIVFSWRLGATLFFLVFSTFVAIFMVIPRIWALGGETDLFKEHHKQLRRMVVFIWLWFGTWLIGVSIGTYSVLSK